VDRQKFEGILKNLLQTKHVKRENVRVRNPKNREKLNPAQKMPEIKSPMFELSTAAKAWASKRRQGRSRRELTELLCKQEERCALSGACLLFDRQLGTPQKGGLGVHPLYPAVDHVECRTGEHGYQIICYALNDVKGHIPFDCFEALKRTEPWQALMSRWKSLAEIDPANREAFRMLIFPNAKREAPNT